MKVLFAVNSENISNAIIKKYQKDYREILSYKNVYYFNAIQKEIQQDKSYDRIIISEDLEPFSNSNYESIDKFIFEKLDGISDEAHDFQGNEIPIILICSDRHTKGSSFLVKLFGISVYNALIGNDRSMEEVCRLINKPRTKKQAKMYYKIDTDDVNYRAENENEVSEMEIQNIIAHFKKLGKNTAKYAASFENIVPQYTDEQLKIIINCLPMNVKAVLEESSEKYQEIMSIRGTMVQGIKSNNSATKQDQKRTGLKIDIIENKLNQTKMTKPIVIPSSVKSTKSTTGKKVMAIQSQPGMVQEEKRVPKTPEKTAQSSKVAPKSKQKPAVEEKNTARVEPKKKNVMPEKTNQVKKVSAQKMQTEEPKVVSKKVQKNPVRDVEAKSKTVKPVRKSADALETKLKKNVVDELEDLEVAPTAKPVVASKTENAEPVKKGRGRPRKNPVENEPVSKPKGKRGRPRKKVIEEDLAELEDVQDENVDLTAAVVENDLLSVEPEEIKNKADDLVSIDDEELEDIELPELDEIEDDFDEFEEFNEFKGSDDSDDEFVADSEDDEEDLLSGFEDDDDDVLADLEDDEEEDLLPDLEEDDDDELMTDLEDDDDELMTDLEDDDDDELMTDLEDDDDDELIPDLEEDDDDELFTEFEDDEDDEDDDELFADFEDDEDDLLDASEDEEDEELLTEFEDDEDEEPVLLADLEDDEDTILPFDEIDDDVQEESYKPVENFGYSNESSVESIQPVIDYSMSNLNSLLTKDKKIVAFLGTSKNGVSFLVNSLADLFASMRINTAIVDMTKNKNSYYMYTDSKEELRKIAYTSIENLKNGVAEGIRVKQNLTVYTALPNDGKDYSDAESILSTLVQNHSLVLIDCDFDTDPSYFASSQEIYLVQSMDVLTIQPLTAFLRHLKIKNVLEPEKIRVVINKELKVRGLTSKDIIGGISFYNDPAMSFMTELFNKDIVKYCTIPFDEMVYSKYLEATHSCKVSINGYSKNFMSKLKVLGDMVYPLTSRSSTFGRGQTPIYAQNNFSSSMNDTLNKMKKKY